MRRAGPATTDIGGTGAEGTTWKGAGVMGVRVGGRSQHRGHAQAAQELAGRHRAGQGKRVPRLWRGPHYLARPHGTSRVRGGLGAPQALETRDHRGFCGGRRFGGENGRPKSPAGGPEGTLLLQGLVSRHLRAGPPSGCSPQSRAGACASPQMPGRLSLEGLRPDGRCGPASRSPMVVVPFPEVLANNASEPTQAGQL